MVQNFKTKLVKKEEVADYTYLFTFQKPADFNFTAGQFISLELPQLSKNAEGGNARFFSIASAPHQQYIEIVMRHGTSPFKKSVEAMKKDDIAQMIGPYGKFLLPQDIISPIIFIAGGMGIAPFRSMLLEDLYSKINRTFLVFYANQRFEDAAFLNHFCALANSNENFIFIPILTKEEENCPVSDCVNEHGLIDLPMIKRYVPDIKTNIYYICGPAVFTDAMKSVLLAGGVPLQNLRFERFEGYKI